MLDGIDIASYQSELVPSRMATTSFVIAKATGGTGYVNPCFKRHAQQAVAAGKKLGCYHYAREIGYEGTAQQEADYFVAAVKGYVGIATLWLDLEAGAIQLGPKWAKAWLDRVYAKTGVKPGLYVSKGVANQYDWSAVSKAGYPLWVAQYPDYEPTGYKRDPWTDSSPFGSWGRPTMFQYTSVGRVTGYDGPLDLDLFYGGKTDWKALAARGGAVAKAAAAVKSAVSNASSASKAKSISRAKLAAAVHRDMVEDESNGYSWNPRWGEDGKGVKTIAVDGLKLQYDRGSYDCSSSVITAWKAALKGTEWEHALDGAVNTYTMREVFVGSGLFSWKPPSFIASTGDLYLDEDEHVAMCQSQVPDLMSEFSRPENGDVYDNQVGDQTGWEAAVNPFREFADGILHYNGKADTVIQTTDAKAAKTVEGATAATAGKASKGTKYIVTADPLLRVRAKRSSTSDAVGALRQGKAVYLDRLKKNKYGNVWARISYGSFKGRFVAVKFGGETLAVKAGAKTVEQLAREVIAGDWGNGQARIDALRKKGYDPDKVQAKVNEILGV